MFVSQSSHKALQKSVTYEQLSSWATDLQILPILYFLKIHLWVSNYFLNRFVITFLLAKSGNVNIWWKVYMKKMYNIFYLQLPTNSV